MIETQRCMFLRRTTISSTAVLVQDNVQHAHLRFLSTLKCSGCLALLAHVHTCTEQKCHGCTASPPGAAVLLPLCPVRRVLALTKGVTRQSYECATVLSCV